MEWDCSQQVAQIQTNIWDQNALPYLLLFFTTNLNYLSSRIPGGRIGDIVVTPLAFLATQWAQNDIFCYIKCEGFAIGSVVY